MSIFVTFIERNQFACELFIADIFLAAIADSYVFGVVIFEYFKLTMIPDQDKRAELAKTNSTTTG